MSDRTAGYIQGSTTQSSLHDTDPSETPGSDWVHEPQTGELQASMQQMLTAVASVMEAAESRCCIHAGLSVSLALA